MPNSCQTPLQVILQRDEKRAQLFSLISDQGTFAKKGRKYEKMVDGWEPKPVYGIAEGSQNMKNDLPFKIVIEFQPRPKLPHQILEIARLRMTVVAGSTLKSVTALMSLTGRGWRPQNRSLDFRIIPQEPRRDTTWPSLVTVFR